MSTNIEKLINSTNKNCKIFGETIDNLRSSQGFYGRMFRNINSLSDDEFAELYNIIEQQDFNDQVDVVLYLEG